MKGNERGGAAVELVLLTPLLILLMLFVVELGRFGVARGDVDGAARDAARAASLRNTAADATTSARDAAEASLAGRDVTCRPLNVAVETGGFAPGGFVAVTVSCSVDLADVTLLGVPGSKQFTSRFVAAIDSYRSAA